MRTAPPALCGARATRERKARPESATPSRSGPDDRWADGVEPLSGEREKLTPPQAEAHGLMGPMHADTTHPQHRDTANVVNGVVALLPA